MRLGWICCLRGLITAAQTLLMRVMAGAALASTWTDASVNQNARYAIVQSSKLGSVTFGVPSVVDFIVRDRASSAMVSGLKMTASMGMPMMPRMRIENPTAREGSTPGHYELTVIFPHAGEYQLVLSLSRGSELAETARFTLAPGVEDDSATGQPMEMRGALGRWRMNREGSGTAWQPESSPMFMKMLKPTGGFEVGAMGSFQAGYVNSGGQRGDQGRFTNSMGMLMARKDVGTGVLGFNLMTSIDPIFNGKRGVPNLFQTGETANGVPLVDRQHPHNLFAELAGSYSHPMGKDWGGFVYGGPVGEPALGNVMFMHRPSGLEVPEAPISHHWFDSTHISFGVVTAGVTYRNLVKLDASLFNGHEPGENRYTIGPLGLNSASARLSYNPNSDWSFSASHGYLRSPEALTPGVDEHRLTASAAYSHALKKGDNLSISGYVGRKDVEGIARASTAWELEGTYFQGKNTSFFRFEQADKDELPGVPAGSYRVHKLLLGGLRSLAVRDQLDYAVGAYLGFYAFPASLEPYYGRHPVTMGVFLRVRPVNMR